MDAMAWLQRLENISDEETANSFDKCKYSQINKPTAEYLNKDSGSAILN